MRTDACLDAVLALAREVSANLAAGKVRTIAIAEEKWRRAADGMVRPENVERVLILSADEATASSTSEAARQAIRNDPDFGPLIGGQVGSSMGTSLFNEDTIISHVLGTISSLDDLGQLEAAVRGELIALRESVTESERSSSVLIPLAGLKSSLLPIELAEGLELDWLTDDEIDACARLGILQPMFHDMRMLSTDECVGVRIAFSSPAIRVAPGEQVDLLGPLQRAEARPHRFGERSPWRFAEIVEDVLFTLRLAGPGRIYARGAVHVQAAHTGTSYSWNTRITHTMLAADYVIDDEKAAMLRHLWSSLELASGAGKSLPSICLRRFNAALDRPSFEDAVVDHMITGEALLLRDTGAPEDRGELGFRLALRGSALLERAGRPRRRTFKFLKRAYDLRSAIAHGGTTPVEVRVPERGEMPIHEFVEELGNLMRDALRIAIEAYSSSSSNFGTTAFWDELLLGSPDPSGAPS